MSCKSAAVLVASHENLTKTEKKVLFKTAK